MTTFSIRDAAREAGVSKTSILRAIQSGRLSAPRNDAGGYAIQPAELFRVFSPKAPQGHRDSKGTRPEGQTVPPSGTQETEHGDSRTAALEAEIVGLKELVRRLDLAHADLRSDRDGWRSQAEAAQRLLSVAQSQASEGARSGLLGSWLRRLRAA